MVPGGFGDRGVKGKMMAARMPASTISPIGPLLRHADGGDRVGPPRRRPAGRQHAPRSTRARPHPVIDIMADQRDIADMGGTMRLGLYPCRLVPGTKAARSLWRAGGAASATATASSSTTPTASGWRQGPDRQRRSRPTGGWWRSSSCATIPGLSAPSSTPS